MILFDHSLKRENPAPDSDGTGFEKLLSAASSAVFLHDQQINQAHNYYRVAPINANGDHHAYTSKHAS